MSDHLDLSATGTWLDHMDVPAGASIPFSLGNITTAEAEHAGEALADIETLRQEELHRDIERQQMQYLVDAAGAYHEWGGSAAMTLDRVVNELELHGYARLPNDRDPTALWILPHDTFQAIKDELEDTVRATQRRMLGYPVLTSHAIPSDRGVFVDTAALSKQPPGGPLEDYDPQRQFQVCVPRPWIVRDPNGVAVLEATCEEVMGDD